MYINFEERKAINQNSKNNSRTCKFPLTCSCKPEHQFLSTHTTNEKYNKYPKRNTLFLCVYKSILLEKSN